MRVPRSVIIAQSFAAVATVGVGLLTASRANWDLPLLAMLMALAMVSDLAAVHLENQRIRVSGSFIALVLCMVLLGGTPAALAGVVCAVAFSLRMREPLAPARHNAIVFGIYPLVGGLAFSAARHGFDLADTTPAYYLLVLGTFVLALGLNFLLIAGYGAVMGKASFGEAVREALLPLLASELVTAVITVGATFLYVKTGLPGLALVGLVILGFQHLLSELIVARQTARELEERTHQLHEQALTDELTGLGNRRRLMEDLATGVQQATIDRPMLLISFDLDGFKQYNDAFGHPEGDLLLRRLARRLRDETHGIGSSYRPGGDEFCVISFPGAREAEDVVATSAGALVGHGEGFQVSCSFGAVIVPTDASDASSALRLADQRMYADKESRPASAKRQARDLLMTVLAEQQPDLHEHLSDVGQLAVGIARELGMSGTEIDDVRRAAELHDVGKIAIPADILAKPGPLDDEEWSYMRRHTLIGERMLAAAPALRGVARLVRSSHEHWNGTGYPDGLAGEDIPLGARIIAVCDTFDAMRSRRSYKPPVPEDETLREIERCAGSHFDPRVVGAFIRFREAASVTEIESAA
jgi:diguanylate cyclase (GGDEF)-like protein